MTVTLDRSCDVESFQNEVRYVDSLDQSRAGSYDTRMMMCGCFCILFSMNVTTGLTPADGTSAAPRLFVRDDRA